MRLDLRRRRERSSPPFQAADEIGSQRERRISRQGNDPDFPSFKAPPCSRYRRDLEP